MHTSTFRSDDILESFTEDSERFGPFVDSNECPETIDENAIQLSELDSDVEILRAAPIR